MSSTVSKASRKGRVAPESASGFNPLAAMVLMHLCDVHRFSDDDLSDRIAQFSAFLSEHDEADAPVLLDLMKLHRGHQTRPAADVIALGRRLAAIAGINPKQKAELPL